MTDETQTEAGSNEPQPQTEAEKTIAAITKLVKGHEETIRFYYCSSLEEQVNAVLRHYQDTTTKALQQSKDTCTDLITYLRAMTLIVEMSLSAATHAEKNSRLRGLIELFEGAIGKLRDQEFSFNNLNWRNHDLFRSDYPTRQYVERIQELEREVAQLKNQPQVNSPLSEIGRLRVGDGIPF